MVHARHFKIVWLGILFVGIISRTEACEHQTLCFLSFLDAGEQILHDSCILLESAHDDAQWMTMHDMLLGQLTRLEYEIHSLLHSHQDVDPETIVLVSDFEFFATIMKKLEEQLGQQQNISPAMLVTIAAIKKHLSTLIYS